MKRTVRLISSLVLIGMLFTLIEAAWAAEPIQQEGLRGQVTAIEGDTLSVVTGRGEENKVITDEDTRFRVPCISEPTMSDIDIGDFIAARGEDGGLLAGVMIVVPAQCRWHRNIVRGRALAIEDLTLRVRTRLGERLVLTDEETRFRIAGVEEPGIAGISVGDFVLALGQLDEEGYLKARMGAVVSEPRLRRHTIRGLIAGIEGDTLSVVTRRGGVEVATDDETVFLIRGVEDSDIDDLKPRDLIIALGSWNGEEQVFVARVVVLMPTWPFHLRFIRGELSGIEGPTIFLQTRQGEVGMLTDEDTIFRIHGVEDPGLDDMRLGDRVGVLATRTQEGTFLTKVFVVRRGEGSFVSEIMVAIEATSTLMGSVMRQGLRD